MVTAKMVKQYLEGNLKMLGDIFFLLPRHLREQVAWRTYICGDDCVKEGVCKYCGCSLPGKLYVKKSCNDGEKFPDLMDEDEWKEYKLQNNIKL